MTFCCLSLLVVVLLQAEMATVLGKSALQTKPCPRRFCLPPPEGSPPCRDECKTDRQCGRGGQCCPGCGCNFCDGGFRPQPRETCQDKVCPANHVCVEEPCKGKICPRLQCIPFFGIRDKPGTCRIVLVLCGIVGPVLPCNRPQCNRDSECPGTQICCIASDCGTCRRCEEPLESPLPPATCLDLTCPEGQICRELSSPRCEKPGTCPDTSTIATTCVVDPLNPGCSTDSDCEGARKCCPYGCQSSCLAPVTDH